MKMPKNDAVNNPLHYQSDEGEQYEHFRVVRAWNLSYCTGCSTKYIKRAGLKNSSTVVEDLRKAIRYLEMEIENIQLKSRKM